MVKFTVTKDPKPKEGEGVCVPAALKKDVSEGKEIDYHRYWKKRAEEAEEGLANALAISESHQKINGKLQTRITELEEDNKKLSSQIEDKVNVMRKAGM